MTFVNCSENINTWFFNNSSTYYRFKMNNVLITLRLNNVRTCSSNIWLSFFVTLIIMSINYRVFVMPLWLITLLSFFVPAFSFISFFFFLYWLTRLWRDYSIAQRLLKVFYLLLLGILHTLEVYNSFQYFLEKNVMNISRRKERKNVCAKAAEQAMSRKLFVTSTIRIN